MKIFILLIFMTSLSIVSIPSAYAQNVTYADQLSQKIAAFSEAEDANNTALAGAIAGELAGADFGQLGFTPHESRELSAGLVEALASAGRRDQAADLLRYLVDGDRWAYNGAPTAEEKSFYRDELIDRLMALAELNQRRQKGDVLIENLSEVHGLLLEQLGAGHPDILPVTNRLTFNLHERARYLVRSNRPEDGLNELWNAFKFNRQHTEFTTEPRFKLYLNMTDEISRTTLEIFDQYVVQKNGDAAIAWLHGQVQRMHKDAPYGGRQFEPVYDKLIQHYQQRAAFFEARGNYAGAERDLSTAETLARQIYKINSPVIPRLKNLRAALLKRWAEQQYIGGDYYAANQTALHAYLLYPSDQVLDAEIKSIYQNSYRAAYQIPANKIVTMPRRARETIVVQEASGGQNYTSYGGTVQSSKFKAVRVFYGTNRVPGGKDFKGKGAGPVRYGWSQVTVPVNRERGVITRNFPGFRPKDEKHFILKRTNRYANKTAFGKHLRNSLKCDDQVFFQDASEPKCERQNPSRPTELFIYIHGHNTPFKEAALRTAQLAVDLDMENGAVFFAWPTGGNALAYRTSERYSRQSREPLRRFLETVIAQSKADQIHLIAHSMGNRVLLNALYDLNERVDPNSNPLFDQIIFASPDVDQDDFVKDVKTVSGLSNGMTLYASNKDKALTLSARINAEKRAGLAPPDPSVINATTKLVVVDTSALRRKFADLIDHDDYTGGAFNDVRSVLWTKARPENRCVLSRQQRQGSLPFWMAKSGNAGCSMKEFGSALEGMRGIQPLASSAR